MSLWDRVERLARGISWLNARLVPVAMGRLDRWLVKHRPLIWRTGLHWIAWWTLLLSTLLAALSAWMVRSPDRCWSASELTGIWLSVQYVSITVSLCWGVLQLRMALGELPWRSHVQLALANAACALLLSLPAPVFLTVTTYQMARVIPDTEFYADLALFERHGYWECSAQLTQELVAADRARIGRALNRFGLTTEHKFDTKDCPIGQRQLIVVGAVDNGEQLYWLRTRVRSIKFSRELWRGGTGDYSSALNRLVRLGVLVAAFAALGLAVMSHPLYAWRRRLPVLPALSLRISFLRISLLGRLDHWLLLNGPIVWAARLHWLIFHCLWIGTIGGGLLWIVGTTLWSRDEGNSFLLFGFAVWFVGLPLVWLATRREDLSLALPRRWTVYVLTTLPPSFGALFLAIGVASWTHPDWLVLGALPLGSLTAVVSSSAAFIRSYQTRFGTFLLLALGYIVWFFLFGVYVFLRGDQATPVAISLALCLFVAWVAILWVLTRAKNGPHFPGACNFLAKLLMVVAPLLFLLPWFHLARLLEAQPLFGSLFALIASTLLVALPFYVLALYPVISVIAATDREPRSV